MAGVLQQPQIPALGGPGPILISGIPLDEVFRLLYLQVAHGNSLISLSRGLYDDLSAGGSAGRLRFLSLYENAAGHMGMFVQDDDPNRVLLGPVDYFVREHLIEQGDNELPILIRAQYLPNYLPRGLGFDQYMQAPNGAGPGAAPLHREVVAQMDAANGWAPGAADFPLNHRGVVAQMDAANGWAPAADVAVEANDAAAPAPLPNNAGNANNANQARIPRPPNAFIGFRKDNHERVKAENPGIHNNDISKIIGDLWNKASTEVRAHYVKKAADAKLEHTRLHPDYKYKPRKSSEKKRRMTIKKKVAIANAAEASRVEANARAEALQEQVDNLANGVHNPVSYILNDGSQMYLQPQAAFGIAPIFAPAYNNAFYDQYAGFQVPMGMFDQGLQFHPDFEGMLNAGNQVGGEGFLAAQPGAWEN